MLTNHPDVYLAACLSYTQKYNRDDQDAAQWKQIWDEWLAEVGWESKRRQMGTGPLQMHAAVREII